MTDLLQQARTFHENGRFEEAVHACRAILQVEPDSIEATHLCGLSCHDHGQAEEAIPLLQAAADAQPEKPEWRFELGLALQSMGRLREAVGAFRRSLELRADNPDGWCRLASALRRLRLREEAAQAYERALQLAPDSEEANMGLAQVLLDLERWAESAERFRNRIQQGERRAEAHHGLGLCLKGQSRHQDAVLEFHAALTLRPRYIEALFNLGACLQALERHEEARHAYEKALELVPDSPEILANLGNVHWETKDFSGAARLHLRALQINPNHAPIHNNLGNALLGLNRHAEAVLAFEKALQLEPSNAVTLCNLGNAWLAQNLPDKAIAFYDRALAAAPGHLHATFNRSLACLLKGDFVSGLPGYELRWLLKRKSGGVEPPSSPWRGGDSCRGRTLLVCCEQGLGDTLQFVRYLPLLQERGARVILRVQPALRALLSRMPGVQIVTEHDQPLPPFDDYCLLLSLPLLLGTTAENIPAQVPYLTCPPETSRLWRERFRSCTGLKVGLVGSGNSDQRNDHNRSLPLAHLKPLVPMEGVRYFLLQKEVRPSDAGALASLDGLVSLAPDIKDFCDTAAIIEQMDLVISVDTAVAHLAGAMGKPVWTLLPFAADWRWLLDRHDSPWYPTMRLFRQESPGNWESVLADVGRQLQLLLSGKT